MIYTIYIIQYMSSDLMVLRKVQRDHSHRWPRKFFVKLNMPYTIYTIQHSPCTTHRIWWQLFFLEKNVHVMSSRIKISTTVKRTYIAMYSGGVYIHSTDVYTCIYIYIHPVLTRSGLMCGICEGNIMPW